jgi:hypothetical protein
VIPIATLYPPPVVSYSDPNITANRFIQSPSLVARALQTFAQYRYVGASLLKGRQTLQGGSIMYELVAGIFADKSVEAVAPLSAYTRGTVSLGSAALAKAQKQGTDYPISDEAIAYSNFDPIRLAVTKAVNSAELTIDQTILAAIVSAVSQSQAASAVWTGASTILRDILLGVAKVTSANLGYRPDMLLVDDTTWAYMASDTVVATAMARETNSNPVSTGMFPSIAGLEIVHIPTANMPSGVNTAAWVLDSSQLGFIAQQELGGGYQSAGDLVESKVLRDDDNDGWRLRVRTNFVPVINNPLAACKITGVN